MHTLELTPVENSYFERIVQKTAWNDPEMPSRLRVADSIACLVQVDDEELPNALVGFSSENVGARTLRPPNDVAEVKQRLGRSKFGWFNNDMMAKGLGSALANTPEALHPSSFDAKEIAVRSVPFGNRQDLYERPELDDLRHQKLRLGRHAVLGLAAWTVDALARLCDYDPQAGSRAAARFMERGYGDAAIVLMPAPPSWQRQQRKELVLPETRPLKILARGGRFAAWNLMTTIGTFPSAARRQSHYR